MKVKRPWTSLGSGLVMMLWTFGPALIMSSTDANTEYDDVLYSSHLRSRHLNQNEVCRNVCIPKD